MTGRVELAAAVRVRALRQADLADVIRIDELHTAEVKRDYWKGVFRGFLGDGKHRRSVALAAENDDGLIGYLLGEVRAFEFGSEPCGWVFGIGVDTRHLRDKVASLLLAESCRRFADRGVSRVRTMVGRNNVPVLSFFRANGFVAGGFVQLEVELEESV